MFYILSTIMIFAALGLGLWVTLKVNKKLADD